MAAQTEPFKAECSASLQSEMRLGANAGWCVAGVSCCANVARRAECSAFLQSEMRLSANAGWCVAGVSCCANGARRAECSAFRMSGMQLNANAGLLHKSNRLRMRAVAVPRKAKPS